MYFLCSGCQQDSGSLACGGSCGQNIVQKQNPLSGHILPRLEPVGPQHIGPALGRIGQMGLGLVVADLPQQGNRRHFQFFAHRLGQQGHLVVPTAQPTASAHRDPGQKVKRLVQRLGYAV